MGRLGAALLLVLTLSSCAVFNNGEEVAKTIWGSSTRALNKARDQAISKTYGHGYWDCIRSSLSVIKKNGWVLFKDDEINGVMVVMGIKGQVNTTEVGIFFDELSDTQVKIDISSLSVFAKRKVAQAFFHGMDIAFGLVPPDKPKPPKKVLHPKQDGFQKL